MILTLNCDRKSPNFDVYSKSLVLTDAFYSDIPVVTRKKLSLLAILSPAEWPGISLHTYFVCNLLKCLILIPPFVYDTKKTSEIYFVFMSVNFPRKLGDS